MLMLDFISGKSFFSGVLFDFFDLCLIIFLVPDAARAQPFSSAVSKKVEICCFVSRSS